MSFQLVDETNLENVSADLALSLDVIYHLVEDDVYEQHMSSLFGIATRAVIIYSSNSDASHFGAHIRHWEFTEWVDDNTDWRLARHVKNPYPNDKRNPSQTSWADFYVFKPRK